MNLVNLKRILKFDYLTFLAITRSFFKDKNFLKHFGFIFGLYFIGIFKFLTSDILYRDDTNRILTENPAFTHIGRHLSERLSHIFHANYPLLTYISPITQLLAILFLSIASMALVKIVNKKITYWGLIASLAVGLSPFFLESLSYKYDSPYMTLAITCAILPFLFARRLLLFFTTSVLFLLCMWNLYQSNNGIYLILSMFIGLNLILQKTDLKQIFKFIFVSSFAFLVALLIYKFFFLSIQKGYSENVTQTITSFAELKLNIKNYISLLDFYVGEHYIKNLFFIISFLFVFTKFLQRKANFIVSIVAILLFLFLSFFAVFGTYYIFTNLNYAPRLFSGFGIFIAVLLITLTGVKFKIFSFCFKALALYFSYTLIVISTVYINAMITYNNYAKFRISQTYSFIQNNEDYSNYAINIKEYIGLTTPVANAITYMPVISHMISYLGGENWHSGWFRILHNHYNLFPRSCKKPNQNPIKIIETKFNKFEIYDNKCVEISYKKSENFLFNQISISKKTLKKSKTIFKDYKLNQELNLSLYNHNKMDFLGLNTIIFEFDKEIPKIADKNDTKLGIHIHIKDKEGFINADQDITNFKKIKDKFYYTVGLGNVDMKDIEKIWIGFLNKDERKSSASFNINFAEITTDETIKSLKKIPVLSKISLNKNSHLTIRKKNYDETKHQPFFKYKSNLLPLYDNPLILEFDKSVETNIDDNKTLEIKLNGVNSKYGTLVQANKKFYYIFELFTSYRYEDDIKTIFLPSIDHIIDIRINEFIKSKKEPIKSNFTLKNDLKLTIYDDNASFFDKDSLIFEFNKEIPKIANDDDTTLYVHLKVKDKEKYVNADKNIKDFSQIDDKFYYVVNLKNEKLENIEKINLGFWNKNTKKSSAKFSINLKEQK
ncbi:MAG: glucosyltransferase domain-containing protein [Campylobacter sp.]|nr:glucosyltransferase domain-containing protein [Campylobacter sp.]